MKIIAADEIVKTDILEFRVDNFSHDFPWYILNDRACDGLMCEKH